MFNLLVSDQILGLKLGLQMNAWFRIIILDLNLACSFKQLIITLLNWIPICMESTFLCKVICNVFWAGKVNRDLSNREVNCENLWGKWFCVTSPFNTQMANFGHGITIKPWFSNRLFSNQWLPYIRHMYAMPEMKTQGLFHDVIECHMWKLLAPGP